MEFSSNSEIPISKISVSKRLLFYDHLFPCINCIKDITLSISFHEKTQGTINIFTNLNLSSLFSMHYFRKTLEKYNALLHTSQQD